MKAIFCLALIFCGIWRETSETVLVEGIDDPLAWSLYNRDFTLDGSSQTVKFPPEGHVLDDFRVTKVQVTSARPNGLKATLKRGGRGMKYADVELRGRAGTPYTFSVTIVFEGTCSRKTSLSDWKKAIASA